jgi:hypothetical protein
MAQSSLMTTTSKVRKYAIYFGIFVVAVIILQICLGIVSNFGGKDESDPSSPKFYPYKEVDNAFGSFSLPDLPSIAISSRSTPEFSVDSDFDIPIYKGVNLYKIEQPRERFATQTKAKDIAQKIGFSGEPLSNDTILRWKTSTATLEYDKITQELEFINTYALPQGNEGLFSNDEESIKKDAIDLIEDIGLNRPNLNLEVDAITIDYLNLEDEQFKQATSPGTAGYIKINVFRKFELASLKTNDKGEVDSNIEKEYAPVLAKAVVEDYQSAPLEIIIAGSTERLDKANLYRIHFIDWTLEDEAGVYEILTPEQAWENVKQGKGSLQELVEFGFDRFTTGKEKNKEVLSFTAQYLETEMAYLEVEEWQGYFYPIYIFKGRAKLANSPNQDNANFVFYAYAIDPNVE